MADIAKDKGIALKVNGVMAELGTVRAYDQSGDGLRAGTMLMFPGEAVHCVNPYTGKPPRMTLSWNINRMALPGVATIAIPRQPGDP